MREIRLPIGRRLGLRRRYIAGAVALLAVTGFGAALTAVDAGSNTGISRHSETVAADSDAGRLTPAQERRAAELAGGSAAGTSGRPGAPGSPATAGGGGTAGPARTAERDVHGGAGAEVLDSAGLPLPKGTPAGRHTMAQVDLYDYATDSLLTRDVDLSTGQVAGTVRRHGVQPPPVADEVRQALALLLADPRLGPGLRTDYTAETGKPLRGPAQLAAQGMTYRAGQAAGASVARCGVHRCVQLFVRVPGGKWIDTSRVVIDLSARRVAVISL